MDHHGEMLIYQTEEGLTLSLIHIFLKVYNVGLPLTAVMLTVRGITQVLGLTLTSGADAAISGIAGIGHIFTGAGLILFILSLKRLAKN